MFKIIKSLLGKAVKLDINEIAILNGNNPTLLGDKINEIENSVAKIDSEVTLSGVGGNSSVTFAGGSGALIFGARQSSNAKVACFFDGLGGVSHFITATSIVVSVSGSQVTVTNNSTAWFPFIVIKA